VTLTEGGVAEDAVREVGEGGNLPKPQHKGFPQHLHATGEGGEKPTYFRVQRCLQRKQDTVRNSLHGSQNETPSKCRICSQNTKHKVLHNLVAGLPHSYLQPRGKCHREAVLAVAHLDTHFPALTPPAKQISPGWEGKKVRKGKGKGRGKERKKEIKRFSFKEGMVSQAC
jgi:hypothetical protein